jgi:hypothetical protein
MYRTNLKKDLCPLYWCSDSCCRYGGEEASSGKLGNREFLGHPVGGDREDECLGSIVRLLLIVSSDVAKQNTCSLPKMTPRRLE